MKLPAIRIDFVLKMANRDVVKANQHVEILTTDHSAYEI